LQRTGCATGAGAIRIIAPMPGRPCNVHMNRYIPRVCMDIS
jgi:hypothetical protein